MPGSVGLAISNRELSEGGAPAEIRMAQVPDWLARGGEEQVPVIDAPVADQLLSQAQLALQYRDGARA
jgi:hypothetical protein